MVGWLVARWFLGGEMVGGEIPWWRDDRIPPLGPTNELPLYRFHLVGYTVILYLGTSNKKKINYGSLTEQLYKLNTTEIQLMSTRFKLSFLDSYKYKNNVKNTLN